MANISEKQQLFFKALPLTEADSAFTDADADADTAFAGGNYACQIGRPPQPVCLNHEACNETCFV